MHTYCELKSYMNMIGRNTHEHHCGLQLTRLQASLNDPILLQVSMALMAKWYLLPS